MVLEFIDVTRVLSAAGLALLATVALIAGAFIGIYSRPSQRTNAIVMAFGTGALIQALAIDLAYHGSQRLTSLLDYSGLSSWAVVSIGFVVGGLAYYLGNKVLDSKGGAIRHPALAKFYFLKKKRVEMTEVLKKISNIQLVRSLPPQEMELVFDSVKPMVFAGSEFIFRKGDMADGLYLITSGQVHILDNHDPQGQIIATLGPGESFGEMALLTGEPRYASAWTATPATLLKVDKEKFDNIIRISPYLRQAVEQLNSQRIQSNVRSEESMDKEHWLKIALSNIERLSKSEEYSLLQKHGPKSAPFAIFLGAMMDIIPESIVIGAGFSDFSSYRYTFLAAVFLANLPEAMASSFAMSQAGFTKKRIFQLWAYLVIAGVTAAALGNIFLLGASPLIITLVEAVAGGAILAMVASVMMPEAYEDGGSEVGLATIAGFLVAFLFTFI
jgi:CRP-like cAMP-binding protein